MLEGKELEGKFADGSGDYSVDVDDKGKVVIQASLMKDMGGLAKVSSVNSVETDIFKIAEAITLKTATTWDDKALAGLKSLLGIQ